MITVTEPQVWAVIGVLTAGLFAILTLMSTQFTRILRAEFATVNARIDGLQGEMNARFALVDARFDAMDKRIDAMDKRIDGLDRDVHYLIKREMDK